MADIDDYTPDAYMAEEKAVEETVKRLMKEAYNAGKSEGMSSAGDFEWGIRHKEETFADWLEENENYLE